MPGICGLDVHARHVPSMSVRQQQPHSPEYGPCRVQFDRRELGVELVKDVDVMPIDPHESLPAGVQLRAVGRTKAPHDGHS